jgi:mono/diheme cytochrome c family protein
MRLDLARQRWLIVSALAVAAAAVMACSTTPRGAQDANLARAREQASQGAELFKAECASCHGRRGEGLTAPAIMGVDALAEYPRDPTLSSDLRSTDPAEQQLRQQLYPGGAPTREPFRTAQDLHNYLAGEMPQKHPGSLHAGQYWSIVTFMLVAHGCKTPPRGVTQANAATVPIRPAE